MRTSLRGALANNKWNIVKQTILLFNFLKKMLDTANKQRIIRIPLEEVTKTLQAATKVATLFNNL